MSDENTKKKTGFFEFEKEKYNPETGKFEILNIKEEKEKLEKYIAEQEEKIYGEEDVEVKANLTLIFNKTAKKIDKELANIKTIIKKEHIGDLYNQLDELKTNLKNELTLVKDEVGQKLVEAGKTNIFYSAPSFELKIGPSCDYDNLQKVIAYANSLGMDVKLYQDGKLVPKTEEKTASKGIKAEKQEDGEILYKGDFEQGK